MTSPSPTLSSLSRSPEESHSLLSSTLGKISHGSSPQHQLQQGQQQRQQQLRRAKYIKVADLATMNKLDIEKIKLETIRKKQEVEHDAKCDTLLTAGRNNTLKDDASSCSHYSRGENKESVKGGEQSLSSMDADHKDNRLLQRMVTFTGGFNLCLLVKNVNIVVEKVRVDKSQVRLAECEVGDETGTVSLRARDGQISLLQDICKQKAAVVLRNCSIELYQGKYIRLAVSKWGKIALYPDGIDSTPLPPSRINGDVHLSIPSLLDMVGHDWLEQSRSRQNNDCAPSKRDSGLNPTREKVKNDNRPLSYPMYTTMHLPYQQHGLVGGYNTNVGHPQIMNSYTRQMYNPNMTISPYGYGQVQPSYLHHAPQQQFEQYLDHGGYIRSYASDYAMHLQMEAMALSYQQHYHRSMAETFAPSVQDHKHYAQQQVLDQRQMYRGYSQGQSVGYSRESPQASFSEGKNVIRNDAATSLAPLPHLSPEQSTNRSIDNNEILSLRLEAKSPMMNPNAAAFTASSPSYNLPNLALPSQHYFPAGQKNIYNVSNSNLVPTTNRSSTIHALSQSVNHLAASFGQSDDTKNNNIDAKSHVQVS